MQNITHTAINKKKNITLNTRRGMKLGEPHAKCNEMNIYNKEADDT